jgi:hypothetical protein
MHWFIIYVHKKDAGFCQWYTNHIGVINLYHNSQWR